jgi:hypothetical protein
MRPSKSAIQAKGFQIAVQTMPDQSDYISITDIARYKSDDPTAVIQNWLRNRETIEFLGLWEQLNNPNFKPLEFEGFRRDSGRNAFVLSPQKWINSTGAIGLQSRNDSSAYRTRQSREHERRAYQTGVRAKGPSCAP